MNVAVNKITARIGAVYTNDDDNADSDSNSSDTDTTDDNQDFQQGKD